MLAYIGHLSSKRSTTLRTCFITTNKLKYIDFYSNFIGLSDIYKVISIHIRRKVLHIFKDIYQLICMLQQQREAFAELGLDIDTIQSRVNI